MSEQRFEDILDECIDRMLRGESWQQVIAAYPQHAAALLPSLQGADVMARAQAPAASAASRAAAQRMMMNEVAGMGSVAGNAAKGGVVMGWMSWFKMRPPVARVAAVGAAAVMFGAVTMGAAAATGNAPDPVKSLFGVSDSVIRVEFSGTITAIEGSTLTVDANGDLRTVIVDAGTDLGDDDNLALVDLAVGDVVEVEGRLQADNSVLATEIRLEDDDDDSPDIDETAFPGATEEPDDDPTADATQDDGDCDNSGSGSPCDHDDDVETPDAQPTADDDDDADDDNSGPGSGDDDGADDDGSGGDDEADDDDSSGPGGGEEADDSSGSDDEPDHD